MSRPALVGAQVLDQRQFRPARPAVYRAGADARWRCAPASRLALIAFRGHVAGVHEGVDAVQHSVLLHVQGLAVQVVQVIAGENQWLAITRERSRIAMAIMSPDKLTFPARATRAVSPASVGRRGSTLPAHCDCMR